MDLIECLKILNDRQAASFSEGTSCPCCKLPEFCATVVEDDTRGQVLEESVLEKVSILSLIDALLHVQESRVKVSFIAIIVIAQTLLILFMLS